MPSYWTLAGPIARVREASWKPQQRVERDLLSEKEQGVSRLVPQISCVKPECCLRALKKRRGSSSHSLTSKDSAQTTIPLVILMVGIPVFAQSPPPSPDRPWHTSDERLITSDGKRVRQLAPPIEPDRAYSLAELIDLAEAHNPDTRVAWENARAQAATLGIARSEVDPTLTAVAVSGVDREEIPLGRLLPPHGYGGSGVIGSQLHDL
jgi:hypothetical protein